MDQQEYKIWKTAKSQGKSDDFIKSAIMAYRQQNTQPEKKGNFLKSIVKEPLKTLLVRPALRAGQALGALGVQAFGTPQMKANLPGAIQQSTEIPGLGMSIEGQKPLGQGGGKQIAGQALETASYLFPYGRAAKAVGGGIMLATGAKITPFALKSAKLAGNVASGAMGGYGFDVGSKLQEGRSIGESLKPGLGTAIGGAIPLAGPTIGGITKGFGRVAAESLGVSTGSGYGAIKEGWQAALQGGKRAEDWLAGLRGSGTPETIVGEARDALGQIIQTRKQTYTSQLEKLAQNKESLDTSPIIKEIKNQLNKFQIGYKNGALDFSRSPLRFNKTAQTDIEAIINTMKDFGTKPGDRTAVGVDSLKRAFGDLYTPSGEARAFIQAVKGTTRKVLSKVPGYDDLAKNYADKTELIGEIQKALSLGDKASIDTAFKKLTSALRVNNEFRKELIRELDEASGGYLSSKVAGQQMSELLPRGIMRQIGGVGALGGLATGVGFVPILKAALFTSPRLIGELVNALGFSVRKLKGGTSGLMDAILKNTGKLKFPGDAFLETPTAKKIGDYAKNPKLGMSIKDVSKDQILKELDNYNPLPEKTNKGLAFGDINTNFRLSQLKEKMQTKSLTDAEYKEAQELLKLVNYK